MADPLAPTHPLERADAIGFAAQDMPVLAALRHRFAERRPLTGHRLALRAHVTAETAVQALTLQAAGAQVALCASSPDTTDPDVSAALAAAGIPVHGRRGMSEQEERDAVDAVLATWPDGPTLVADEGGELIAAASTAPRQIVAATEKTPSGGRAVAAAAHDGRLPFPVLLVDECFGKNEVDNAHGTAQSLLETVVALSRKLLAGKTFVVGGYGRVGAGVAHRARGLGATVLVAEVRPTRALVATLDGFEVLPMIDAASRADFILTVTGVPDVVTGRHLDRIRDGAVLANGGHHAWEINAEDLRARTVRSEPVRPGNTRLTLTDGRRLHLLAGGQVVNLAAGSGNAAEVMDVTFGTQVLALVYLAGRAGELPPAVHPVPPACDDEVVEALAAALELPVADSR